jgi:hypothetical protein
VIGGLAFVRVAAMGMSLEPGAGLGSKSGLFWRVPNMHESDDPRGKKAGDERLQVSDSLSETDPIPPNRAQDKIGRAHV